MTSQGDNDEDEEESDSNDAFLRAVAATPARAPESLSEQLTRLGHFDIEEKIGRGGMGIVFRARDTKLGRIVALKVLPADFSDDTTRRKRFLREARMAASITHPNVATVHEVGEADGRIYIAMELIPGQTLRQRMDAGSITIEESRRIVTEIARAVAKAHELGITHRDLKPDNVMVSVTDGAEALSVKVLDFGLAKPTEEVVRPEGTPPTASLTQEGGILGTPGYMSPEQATGREVDLRTDVFSLGIILYELVTGTRPFTGETAMDALIATSRDAHAPATSLNAATPAWLSAVIDRCLKKDPADRFATADALVVELDAGSKGQTFIASARDLAAERRGVSPWMVGALAVVGAAGIGFLATRGDHAGEGASVASSSSAPLAGVVPVVTGNTSSQASAAFPSDSTLPTSASTMVAPSAAALSLAAGSASWAHVSVAPTQHPSTSAVRVAASSSTSPPIAATPGASAASPASPGGVIQSSPY